MKNPTTITTPYRTPITACDQWFNHLLEPQSDFSCELARLHRSNAEGPTHGGQVELLGNVIASSARIDDETKQDLVSRLHGRE